MPYVVAAPQFGRPSSGPRSSGPALPSDGMATSAMSNWGSPTGNTYGHPYGDSRPDYAALSAAKEQKYFKKAKKHFKPLEDFENSIMKDEVNVNEIYKPRGKTLRQIFNSEIARKYPVGQNSYRSRLDEKKYDMYFPYYGERGRYSLQGMVATKRRLLLKGAKPKTTLSPLGRTLKFKSNAPLLIGLNGVKQLGTQDNHCLEKKRNFQNQQSKI